MQEQDVLILTKRDNMNIHEARFYQTAVENLLASKRVLIHGQVMMLGERPRLERFCNAWGLEIYPTYGEDNVRVSFDTSHGSYTGIFEMMISSDYQWHFVAWNKVDRGLENDVTKTLTIIPDLDTLDEKAWLVAYDSQPC